MIKTILIILLIIVVIVQFLLLIYLRREIKIKDIMLNELTKKIMSRKCEKNEK